jgi:hypothetical protein
MPLCYAAAPTPPLCVIQTSTHDCNIAFYVVTLEFNEGPANHIKFQGNNIKTCIRIP